MGTWRTRGHAILLTGSLAAGCASPAPGNTIGHVVPVSSATPASSVAPSAAVSASRPAVVSPRPAPWDGVGPFTLHVTDFHFELGGTQVLTVDDGGKVRDLFVRDEMVPTRVFCADAGADIAEICRGLTKRGEPQIGVTRWYIAEYTLTDDARAELRRSIVTARLASLDARYASSTIPDGTTRKYRLVTGAGAVVVATYSTDTAAEPPPLLTLLRFVQAQQKAHATTRAGAREASGQARMAIEREANGS